MDMKNTEATTDQKLTPQQVADAIAELPRVEMVRKIGNRIMVQYPRERGGRTYFTIPAARAHLARVLERMAEEK